MTICTLCESGANTVDGNSYPKRHLVDMLNISTEFLFNYLKIYYIKLIIYKMNFECNICLSNEVKPLSIINCNHLFYTECIERWLYRVEHCPICRTNYYQSINIEKIKSEYELLKSKCNKLKEEEQTIIK